MDKVGEGKEDGVMIVVINILIRLAIQREMRF
jgi:hypothetical protein